MYIQIIFQNVSDYKSVLPDGPICFDKFMVYLYCILHLFMFNEDLNNYNMGQFMSRIQAIQKGKYLKVKA